MTSRTFKSSRGAVSNKRAQSRRRTPNRRYHRARRRIGGFTLNKKIQRVHNTVKVGKDAAEWRGRRRVKQVKKRMYCRRTMSHKSSIRSKHTHKKVHRLRSKYGGASYASSDEKTRKAACVLHRMWRRYRVPHQTRTRKAACVLQRVWRGYRVRHQTRTRKAACVLQRVWRGYPVRRYSNIGIFVYTYLTDALVNTLNIQGGKVLRYVWINDEGNVQQCSLEQLYPNLPKGKMEAYEILKYMIISSPTDGSGDSQMKKEYHLHECKNGQWYWKYASHAPEVFNPQDVGNITVCKIQNVEQFEFSTIEDIQDWEIRYRVKKYDGKPLKIRVPELDTPVRKKEIYRADQLDGEASQTAIRNETHKIRHKPDYIERQKALYNEKRMDLIMEARKNDLKSLLKLGRMYMNGNQELQIKPNHSDAKVWLNKVVKIGNEKQIHEAEEMLYTIKLEELLQLQGDIASQFRIGDMYIKGKHSIKPDKEQAKVWLNKVMQSGHDFFMPKAQELLRNIA